MELIINYLYFEKLYWHPYNYENNIYRFIYSSVIDITNKNIKNKKIKNIILIFWLVMTSDVSGDEWYRW